MGGFQWASEPVRAAIEGSLPPDPFERRDLDAVLTDFSGGAAIAWNAAFAVAKPGPPGRVELSGPDWDVTVDIDRPFTAPAFVDDGEDDRQVDVEIGPPVMLVSVGTGQSSVSRARDVGRPRLRAILGCLSLKTPLLVGASLEWEGPGLRTAAGRLRLAAARTRTDVTISDRGVEKMRSALARLELRRLRPHHHLALEWLAESWGSQSLPIKFANLWFAVVVAADGGLTPNDRRASQMERIRLALLRVPLSATRRNHLLEQFRDAYSLRNRVVHEDDRRCVTQATYEALWFAASEFLSADVAVSA